MLIPVLASLLLAAQAAQPDPAIEADAACVASLSYVASTMPKERQAEVAPLVTYYVGRIDAKRPDLNLQAAIIRQFSGKSEAELKSFIQTNAQRCGMEMVQLGHRLQSIGKSMTEYGK